jgi:hypothetical protein
MRWQQLNVDGPAGHFLFSSPLPPPNNVYVIRTQAQVDVPSQAAPSCPIVLPELLEPVMHILTISTNSQYLRSSNNLYLSVLSASSSRPYRVGD